jgi:hypothetical protein
MTTIQHRVRCALTASIALIGVVSALALTPAPASAAIRPELVRFGEHGTGAGQLRFAGGGIAADPDTGHLFVSERWNNRISEFTAWGEFVKAWGWGVANGNSEAQTCGPPEPTAEPETSLCQAGIDGAKAGQLGFQSGIALGPNDALYVFERDNFRVQVFDQSGAFVRMFGGGVNKTTGADICTAADITDGDECGSGIEGTGPSEFSVQQLVRTTGDYIDIAADGTVYVGDRNRIQKFDEDGNYLSDLKFTGNGAPGQPPEPGNPGALSLDPASGDIYFSYRWGTSPANSYRLDGSTGTVVYALPATAPEAIATAPGGTVFITDDPVPVDNSQPFSNPHLLEFDSLGEEVDECCPSTSKTGERITLPAATTNVVTASGEADLYVVHDNLLEGVGFIEVRGTPPDKWPPPVVPPDINAQFASSVGSESAVLKAEVNPNFWADTAYQLEYGAEDCSGGGCQAVLPASRQLGAGIVKRDVTTDGVVISGLQPGATYHYRFAAESGGGGPVYGPDRTFTTYALPQQTSSACPNQALRSGPSAALADCRAYEMTSPVDKEGADISTSFQLSSRSPARLDQGSASGEKITYSASTAFGDAPSGPFSSQYLSTREQDSWSTTAISPAQDSASVYVPDDEFDSHFKAFSDDLSSGWLVQGTEPQLAPGALQGFGNLYRRDNLSAAYEALTTVAPPGVAPESFYPTLLGFSADGSHTFFRAKGQLTPDASSNTAIQQVYEAHEGQLSLVSVKPNGTPATASSTVGASKASLDAGRESNTDTAVSEDGRLVYWTEEVPGAAKLYLRVEAAETIAISGASSATFWRASPDGERMLYDEEAGQLKRFEYSTRESSTLVPSGVLGVMGASDDLSRIYFASKDVLAAGATAGEPNLYLHEDGEALRFIATLGGGELLGTNLIDSIPPVALDPMVHFARVTPDGSVAIFMSRGALTGKDNLDRDTGEPVAEVFRYDADADSLACVSCLSTGARPQGDKLNNKYSDYPYAAKIPGAELQFHAPRVLSEDGSRVYFDSVNRLTLADTNGRQDVYQWEVEGKGECVDSDAPGYDPASGGCVTLVSDGRGSTEAEFIDASADGSDVFFFTGTSLLPQDIGQIDVYDARVNGGFPQPPAQAAQCEGEACQSPVSPPSEPPYASQAYQGPGSPKADKQKKAKAKKKSAKRRKAKQAKRRQNRAQREDKGGRR